MINLNWTTETQLFYSKGDIIKNWKKIKLDSKDHFIVRLRISPNNNQDIGSMIEHLLKVKIKGLNTQIKKFSLTTQIGTFDIFSPEPDREVKIGNLARFNISVQNIIDQNNSITLNYSLSHKIGYNIDSFIFELQPKEIILDPGELVQIEFNVTTPFNAEAGTLMIEITGSSNLKNKIVKDILKLTLNIVEER
jgi:hypothetical protein